MVGRQQPTPAEVEMTQITRLSYRRRSILSVALVVVLVGVAVGNLVRPVPPAQGVQTLPQAGHQARPPQMPWPAGAQAALAMNEGGPALASPHAHPLPIASVTKVMTALLTLEARPLAEGQQGPTVTLTDADVQSFQAAQGGSQSAVAVQAGEQLTEYQLLQGLLIPSGNNLASTLARWVAGSEPAFVQKMNARASALGMRQTKFVDASGASDGNVSTPSELTYLAQAAMASPAFATIVAQPQAELPVAGTVYNVDALLGQSGISGIKTGSLPEGAMFLFAASVPAPGGGSARVVGAVQGLPTLDEVFAATTALLAAVPSAVERPLVARRGQAVGRYEGAWGSSVPLLATQDLAPVVWKGTPLTIRLELPPTQAPVGSGSVVGNLEAVAGRGAYAAPVTTDGRLEGPGPAWRAVRLPWTS
jgi:serine-type D-Ala-D-Ala carboxypeptidase (penicillin-binding protein 5/6)